MEALRGRRQGLTHRPTRKGKRDMAPTHTTHPLPVTLLTLTALTPAALTATALTATALARAVIQHIALRHRQ